MPAKASENFTSFSQSLPIVQCPTSTHALKWKSNNVTMFYCLPDIAYPLSMSWSLKIYFLYVTNTHTLGLPAHESNELWEDNFYGKNRKSPGLKLEVYRSCLRSSSSPEPPTKVSHASRMNNCQILGFLSAYIR